MISVIIPYKHEFEDLVELLDSLSIQKCKDFEVIIVYKNYDPLILYSNIQYSFPIKTIKERKPHTPAHARNMGAKKSKGDYLVFLDADNTVKEDFIANCKMAFLTEKVFSTHTLPKKNSFFKNIVYAERMSALNFKKITPNCYKKSVFESVKGFNNVLSYGEDADIGDRLRKKGYFVEYLNGVQVFHDEVDFKGFIKQSMWYGKTFIPYLRADKKRWLIVFAMFFRVFGWATSFTAFFWFLYWLHVFMEGWAWSGYFIGSVFAYPLKCFRSVLMLHAIITTKEVSK